MRKAASGNVHAVAMVYRNARYEAIEGRGVWGSHRLRQHAANGDMVVTLTARAGSGRRRGASSTRPLAGGRYRGPGAQRRHPLPDGHVPRCASTPGISRRTPPSSSTGAGSRAASAAKSARCRTATTRSSWSRSHPRTPIPGGLHFLQLQNPRGLFSNDLMFFSEQSDLPARSGNLITSGGAFTTGQFDNNWNTVELVANSIRRTQRRGLRRRRLRARRSLAGTAQPRRDGRLRTGIHPLLPRAVRRAQGASSSAYVDTDLDDWRNLSGGQHRADLSLSWRSFRATRSRSGETDLKARVAFDFRPERPRRLDRRHRTLRGELLRDP